MYVCMYTHIYIITNVNYRHFKSIVLHNTCTNWDIVIYVFFLNYIYKLYKLNITMSKNTLVLIHFYNYFMTFYIQYVYILNL